MNKSLLEKFRKAYQDLELFPLITVRQVEAFRVDFANETIARLEQAVEDAPSNGKIMFAGHRGCGKSSLLAKFAKKMKQQEYFVAFCSFRWKLLLLWHIERHLLNVQRYRHLFLKAT